MATVLIIYAAVLATVSIFLARITDAPRAVPVVAGLLGASLCGAWGLASMVSHRGRALPVLLLIALSFIFLSQAVNAWWDSRAVEHLLPRILLSLSFLSTIGILVYVLYAERPASFWTGRAGSTPTPPRDSRSN
jgi:hypothetical protein